MSQAKPANSLYKHNESPVGSWGNFPKLIHDRQKIRYRYDGLPVSRKALLPYGRGRSYGDSCLNADRTLLDTSGLSHFIIFDPAEGLIQCEAGAGLEDILNFAWPRRWFLPVVPGTQFVTVGGAIANDIHGKNHHRAGTFGCHVKKFELLRSDGTRLLCSPDENTGWFEATIGGLGLTGLITWAEIQLKKIAGPLIQNEALPFSNIDEFFELSNQSDRNFEYTVAWVDSLASAEEMGRGILFRGNHAADEKADFKEPGRKFEISVPFDFPPWFLNSNLMRAFNRYYYRNHLQKRGKRLIPYQKFFFPLDAVRNWNRIYGKRGFFQHQSVIPGKAGPEPVKEILRFVSKKNAGSFLTVLKRFGDQKSPGMMSFPRQGTTLALDFANRGPETLKLLDQLDEIVMEAEGTVYPAKDARMSPHAFRAFFPQWEEFAGYMDPKFSSNFWRRVTADI